MPNAPQIDVKRKHRKRKERIKRNQQENILNFAKKKTIQKLHEEGKLPKIAMGRL
jgi:hypothetical protein